LDGVEIIGSPRTEPVNIHMPSVTAAGIPVVYAPGRNARAVAEFTVGLIIAETRNLARSHAALAQGIWRSDLYLYDRAPRELAGQTVGLIGFGNIGKLMPGYLHAFGMRVLAYDPYVPDAAFSERGVERVTDMAALLAASDIVSLHARVTPETRGFLGEPQFRQMKRGAYFINTARGPMVDYDALYRALAGGHLAGAGLETFAIEPMPPDAPLLRLPNVTLSPHIAGRPLAHCANPEVLSHGRR
jgi:D-3-phosphoglycerate dehydrogenase